MGQDNTAPEFHQALLPMLNDPNPMVQRNAALSLVRFQDDSGHAQIVSMLQPYVMEAPLAGVLSTRLKAGDIVNPGTLVGHIEVSREEQRSPRERTRHGGPLARAERRDSYALASQSSRWLPTKAWPGKRCARYFSQARPNDLPYVKRFVRGIRRHVAPSGAQAQATARAIQDRANQ